MKYLVILLFITTPLQAGDFPTCPSKANPIYCSILKLRPNIGRSLAFNLSNYLHKYSRKYRTNPYRSVAIAMQESAIRNISVKEKVLVNREVCYKLEDGSQECDVHPEFVEGYTDIGLWQFHVNTVHREGIDPAKLLSDLDYATEWHVKFLARKMRHCRDLDSEAWTCYHSRTPKYRKKYLRMVNRYYNKIRSR